MALTRATRFSRKALAAALVLSVTPLAASAQEDVWKWTSGPQQTEWGGHCWMSIAHAGRTFSLHAISGVGNFLSLDSPGLTGLTGQQEGRIIFAGDTPQGERYTLRWSKGKTPSTWQTNGIGENGVIAILQGFVMADTAGSDMSVSFGQSGVMEFPAAGSTEAAEGFAGCWDQL